MSRLRDFFWRRKTHLERAGLFGLFSGSAISEQSEIYLCKYDDGSKKYEAKAVDPERCKKVDLTPTGVHALKAYPADEKLAKRCLAHYAKEKLSDPASAYLINHRITKYENAKRIDIEFSAGNSFGGKVRDTTVCVVDGGKISPIDTEILLMKMLTEGYKKETERLRAQ